MSLTGNTKIAGIMGCPVKHSLSPVIHNFWMREYDLDGVYIPLPGAPDALERAVSGLAALGFSGVNLTIPHKEAVIPYLDDLRDAARKIGAVNTIRVRSDGTLEGDNTDGFGFRAAIEHDAPDGWSPAGKPVVVCGAGGAARAIIHALKTWRAGEIRIVNRTFERAESLADEFDKPCKPYDWATREEILDGAALLVNTTQCGMVGEPPLDISLKSLPVDAIVNDIVYAPLITPLLADALERGNIIVDGLGMLLHQARPAFRGWFDIDPAVTPRLRDTILAAARKG